MFNKTEIISFTRSTTYKQAKWKEFLERLNKELDTAKPIPSTVLERIDNIKHQALLARKRDELSGVKYNLEQFNQMNNGEFKCEVFQYKTDTVWTLYFNSISNLTDSFSVWEDFPTLETFFRVFIDNKQKTFEKLWLDDKGDILTRMVFTKEK